MLIGFIVGGFIFFTLIIYFVVLILFPEWVGVSGRDHEKFLAEQREQSDLNSKSALEALDSEKNSLKTDNKTES